VHFTSSPRLNTRGLLFDTYVFLHGSPQTKDFEFVEEAISKRVRPPMSSGVGMSGGIGGHTDPIDHQHGDPLQPNSPWAKQNVLTFGMTLDQDLETIRTSQLTSQMVAEFEDTTVFCSSTT
jgi:hypothetical protein